MAKAKKQSKGKLVTIGEEGFLSPKAKAILEQEKAKAKKKNKK